MSGFELKIIRNDDELDQAKREIRKQSQLHPEALNEMNEREQLIRLLIRIYEEEKFQSTYSDPIDAIKCKMDQKRMKQRDLVPILGSHVVVSQILNRKRSLTFEMMKALSIALDIPVKLFFEYDQPNGENSNQILDQFPYVELIKKRWIKNNVNSHTKPNKKELFENFFSNKTLFDFVFNSYSAIYEKLRKHIPRIDTAALLTWEYMALQIALKQHIINKDMWTDCDYNELRRLTILPDGPLQAQRFLSEHGIHLVILPHLKDACIDSAVILPPCSEYPIISLTLRHDTIDMFWFSLFTALGHLALHHIESNSFIFDILDYPRNDMCLSAINFANYWLIKDEEWTKFNKSSNENYSVPEIDEFAKSIKLHPAIVAGRIRREKRNLHLLSREVGFKEIRKLFGGEFYGLE